MANQIRGGSIYYTVGVDRKSLDNTINQLKMLGQAATASSKAFDKGNPFLVLQSQRLQELSGRVAQVSKAYQDLGGRDSNLVQSELEQLLADLQKTRAEWAAYGDEVVKSSQDQAQLAQMLGSLDGQIARVSSQLDVASNGFTRTTRTLEELRAGTSKNSAEFRSLSAGFDRGAVTANRFKESAERIAEEVKGQIALLRLLRSQVKNNVVEYAKFSNAIASAEGLLTRINTKTEMAAGGLSSMALRSKLSYGGLTLLNDRIFQLSPALGILTNQLIFTTQSLGAFLSAALPIVAVAGTIIGVFGGIVSSIRSATGLESALADVRKTTGLTSQELNSLTQSFQETSKEIPITVDELLNMAKVAGQLGITGAENIERFADTVARLAIATDVVGEEGATSLARFLQATGTEMEEMGREAERVANVLNALENTTAATAAEILQMTSYTQGLSSQAGLTTDQILGINAALLSLGVKAEAGGSAIVRTMSKIQQASSESGESIAAFAEAAGMTVEKFDSLVRSSPLEALMSLAEGMNATAEAGGSLNDVLTDLGINEVRERRAMLALAQGFDTLEEAIYNARRESFLMNSLNAEVAIQADTLASKLRLLRNRFVEIGQDIGSSLLPTVKALADFLIIVADNIEVLIVATATLAANLGSKLLLSALGAARASLRRFNRTLVVSVGRAQQAGKSFAALRGIFALLGGPAGLITLGATALTGFATALIFSKQKSDEAKVSLDKYLESLESTVSELLRARNIEELGFVIDSLANTMEEADQAVFRNIGSGILNQLEQGTIDFTEASQQLFETINRFSLQGLGENVNVLRQSLSGAIGDVDEFLEYVGPELLQKIGVEPIDIPINITSDISQLREFRAALAEEIGGLPEFGETAGYRAVLIELATALDEVLLAERDFQSALEIGEELRAQVAERTAEIAPDEPPDSPLEDLSRAAQDFDPLGPIDEQLITGRRKLENDFYKTGEIGILAFKQGILDNEQDVLDALSSFLSEAAGRGATGAYTPLTSFIEAVQEAGGTDVSGEFLVSWEEAREEAQRIIDRAVRDIEYGKQRIAASETDLLGTLNNVITVGLTDAEDAFNRGLIDPIERANRSIEFHNQLYNLLIEEYGEFSDSALVVKGLIDEETEARDALLANIDEQNRATEYQLGFQQAFVDAQKAANQALGDRMIAEATLNGQLSRGEITQSEYLQSLIGSVEAQYEAEAALDKNSDAAQSLRNELEELNQQVILNNIAEEEHAQRLEDSRAAMAARAEATDWSAYTASLLFRQLSSLTAGTEEYERALRQLIDTGAANNAVLSMLIGDASNYDDALSRLLTSGYATAELLELLAERFGEVSETTKTANEFISEYNSNINRIKAGELVGTIAPDESVKQKIDLTKQAMQQLTTEFLNGQIGVGAYQNMLIILRAELAGLEAQVDDLGDVDNLSIISEGFSDIFSVLADSDDGDISSFFNILSDLIGEAPNIYDGFKKIAQGFKEGSSAAAKQTISEGLTAVFGTLESILPDYESTANKFVKATLEMTGALVGGFIAGPQGAQAGAAIGGFISDIIGDLSNGIEQIRKQVEEAIDSTNYLSGSLVQAFADMTTETVSRGGLAGAYGATKQQLDEEAFNEFLDIAQPIASGLAGALRNGINGAIRGETEWKDTLRKSLRESMVEQIMMTFIETTLTGGAFDEFIKEFTKLLQAGDWQGAMKHIEENFDEVAGNMEDRAEEFAEKTGDYFKEPVETLGEAIERVFDSAIDNVQFLSESTVRKIVRNAVRGGNLDEEIFNEMLSIADSVAGGFSSGLTRGINEALSGNQDWKTNLQESLRSTIMNSIINSFVQTAVLEGVFGNFFATISQKIRDGDTEGAMKYASEELDRLSGEAANVVNEFLGYLDDEFSNLLPQQPDDNQVTDGGISAGTQISEITGPTRDLLTDLLTPLSILPSWTSMIRDIRNDVRSIASGSGTMGMASMNGAPLMTPVTNTGTIQSQTIVIQNATITTQAKNAKELYNELSDYAYKESKGGKG